MSMFLPRRKSCGFSKVLVVGLAVNSMLVVFQFAEFNLVPISRLKSAGKQVPNEQTTNAFESKKDDVLARKLNQSPDFKERLPQKVKEQNVRVSGMNYYSDTSKLSTEQVTQSLHDSGSPTSSNLEKSPSISSETTHVGISTKEHNTENKLKFADSARPTELKDIFISVKTTSEYHRTRVTGLLQTWVQLAKSQVHFFTDSDDNLTGILGPNMINTKCGGGHQRNALCCKMQSEFEFFLQKFQGRWFCHFDDDNYVNVPALVRMLRWYKHTQDVYLGKPSLQKKMKTIDRDQGNQVVSFWFATGGAGFCISKALMIRMEKYVSEGKFLQICNRIRLPDDCTVGFISEVLLNTTLTKSPLFHSHLENLSFLQPHQLEHQVSFSHGYLGKYYNRVLIAGAFNDDEDPSRFKSIHCFLNPSVSWCPPSSAA